jgi:hypothetical protein
MIIYTFAIYRSGFETSRISITEDIVKKVSIDKDGVCFKSKNEGYKTPIRFVQCFTSGCCSDKFDEAIIVSFLGHKKTDVMKLFYKFQDIVKKKSIDVDLI